VAGYGGGGGKGYGGVPMNWLSRPHEAPLEAKLQRFQELL